jgi:PhzF family phenazine biosynthesis protein
VKKLSIYQVDAFTNEVYKGNPAAVVPLQEWLPPATMQSIAAENNLAETAFFVQEGNQFHIRWFTPMDEVPLCGHATLASAYVIFNELGYDAEVITFTCQSGLLSVSQKDGWITMNFPAIAVGEVPSTGRSKAAFGLEAKTEYSSEGKYVLFEFESSEDIQNISPDFNEMLKWEERAIIVTAKGDNFDFVSRMFAPKIGVNEDPVTGSAHTRLIPFWSNKLNKTSMLAKQLSYRGGILKCEHLNDRVEMIGEAALFLKGEIYI